MQDFDPSIRFDIRYATSNNFLKKPLHPRAAAFLRRPAAEALKQVQGELAIRGMGLLNDYGGWRTFDLLNLSFEQLEADR